MADFTPAIPARKFPVAWGMQMSQPCHITLIMMAVSAANSENDVLCHFTPSFPVQLPLESMLAAVILASCRLLRSSGHDEKKLTIFNVNLLTEWAENMENRQTSYYQLLETGVSEKRINNSAR